MANNLLAIAATFVESTVPVTQQAVTLSGVHLPNEAPHTSKPARP